VDHFPLLSTINNKLVSPPADPTWNGSVLADFQVILEVWFSPKMHEQAFDNWSLEQIPHMVQNGHGW